jgi:ubiquinone/menaquinone biosynthesis C-methylase UbiE
VSRHRQGPAEDQLRQQLANTHFAEHAQDWEDIYSKQDVHSVIHQHRLTTALGWIEQLSPARRRVLEIGCGAGLLTVALAQRGALVTATDVVAPMIGLTRDRARDSGVADQVATTMADAHALPFRDAEFDLAVALGVMPWVTSPAAVVAEVVRVLKPGGCVVVNGGNRVRLNFVLDPRLSPYLAAPRRATKTALGWAGIHLRAPEGPYANLHTPGEFDDLLRSAGLEKVTSASIGFGPFVFWRRQFLPDRLAVSLHWRLQRLADQGWPPLRSSGAQYLVLARKPAVAPTGV